MGITESLSSGNDGVMGEKSRLLDREDQRQVGGRDDAREEGSRVHTPMTD